MNAVRIVAAVVDVRQLKLYKEDGSTIDIPQGDPRVARLIAEITPVIRNGGVAEVTIEAVEGPNAYREFEETSQKSGGLVKLFRMAKKKVEAFFTRVPDMQIGYLPEVGAMPADEIPSKDLPDSAPATKEEYVDTGIGIFPASQNRPVQTTAADIQKLDHALEDIMKHAVPVAHKDFSQDRIGDEYEDTVVAVVQKADGSKTIVPGVEKIKNQLMHANTAGSSKAMEAFLARLGNVIDKRSHSIDDLLNFMKRGDLPIAEDGSIIIYKVLNEQGNRYVDCHTHKVTQRIGSFVHMDEKHVDPNRRNECSNGLHVARRGYLGGFTGNVCVLAKVRPEDVIAVPPGEPDKMRVCGYHILFPVSNEDYRELKNNRPITSEAGRKQLTAAIEGRHVGIIEYVKINGAKGTEVVITQVEKQAPILAKPATDESSITLVMSTRTKKQPVKVPAKVKKLAEAIDLDPPPPVSAPIVDPKDVAQKTQPVVAVKTTQAERVAELYKRLRDGATSLERTQAGNELQALKKAARKSWTALGLSDEIAAQIVAVYNAPIQNLVKPVKDLGKVNLGDAQKDALKLLKAGKLTSAEIAERTGLSKDQIYRLKKKLST